MWEEFQKNPELKDYEARRLNQVLNDVRWAIWYKVGFDYIDILGDEMKNKKDKEV